jgi:DNA-directed RNA polymerase subunit beta
LEDQQIEILYLIQKFSNFQIYDIGDLRRKYINERFNQRIPTSLRCIIPTDFIRSISELNILTSKKTIRRFDDLDNLRTRRLCRVGYLLQRELKQEIFKLNRRMCQQCRLPLNYRKQNIIQFISFILFDHRIHRFITINPLFHYADHINFLTNITQKRRLTGIGIGSLNVPTRNKKVRDIHPSHFGRLCISETPDGKNAGLVIFLTIMRQFNDNNLVQFMICNKQKDHLQNVFERLKLKPLVSIWKFQKDKDWVAQLSVDILGKFESNLEMVLDDRYLTDNVYIKMIGFITTQMFALSTNLIPFLQNNDANRVLMGANMIRQSLSTMKFLSSRISSGVDIFVRNDMGQNLYACCPGIVVVCAIVSLHFLFLKEYAKTYYIVRISLLQKYVKSENKMV